MELRQLQYFQTVARLESMTKAARFYRIPQPSMSQTISRLEKELGTELFIRSGNRIELSRQGKLFSKYVDSVLGSLQDGITALKEESGEVTGEVRLLILENRNTVIDWIADFARSYPGITFSICHDQQAERGFIYDLCIAAHRPHANLAAQSLIEEEILLAVPEGHRLADRKMVSPDMLSRERFICMPPQSSLYRVALERCRYYGFEPNPVIICDDPYVIRRYVAMGMGVAFIPAVSWQGLMGSSTVLLHLDDRHFCRTTYLMWDDSRYMANPVVLLREHILANASGSKYRQIT